jgi:hypothetical protein
MVVWGAPTAIGSGYAAGAIVLLIVAAEVVVVRFVLGSDGEALVRQRVRVPWVVVLASAGAVGLLFTALESWAGVAAVLFVIEAGCLVLGLTGRGSDTAPKGV